MRSTRKNGRKNTRKENKIENDVLFQKAYLDDPEYRKILIKKIVEEDKEMQEITDELAKLFSSLSED